MSYVVFTHLDGSLLGPSIHSCEDALPAVRLLREQKIPIVFCSSKTRGELEFLRKKLGVRDPFITENGGAIYIEKGYFSLPPKNAKSIDQYHVIQLGLPYQIIRKKLKEAARDTGIAIRGYGDVSVEDIVQSTGLAPHVARLAQSREHEEIILNPLSSTEAQRLRGVLSILGLTLYRCHEKYSVRGHHNKGMAVIALARMFKQQDVESITVAIGKNSNDIPMLASVHIPMLVQQPRDTWEKVGIRGVKKIAGVGPDGWTRAVKRLLSKN